VKLAIVRDYAAAYSRILAKQRGLEHFYIDAFAGAGVHASRSTGDLVPGSPTVALQTRPPFTGYHFIDLNRGSLDTLRGLVLSGTAGAPDLDRVRFYNADCNDVLLSTILPQVRYDDYRRALCLLDPYGLDLDWAVVQEAGQMKSVELFVNFPIQDMNRNVLRRDTSKVAEGQADRLTRFWGDSSWKEAAYSTTGNFFGYEEKRTNADVVGAYRDRLMTVAGFEYVPEPMPMRNGKGAVVYYLFFASQNATGRHIVGDIFTKWGQ
jgi:three-Cys-motif partner protein